MNQSFTDKLIEIKTMTNKLAFVFPGQGSQYLGMLQKHYEQYQIIQNTFAEAADVLHFDVWEITQSDKNNLINQTEYTQPIILTASIALWRLYLEQDGKLPSYLAGHSLGEYSALVAAESLSFEDAVKLVYQRGCEMQQAVPANTGAMAAILGLSDEQIISICADAAQNEIVSAVNFNAPGQVVIAGHTNAVERAINLCKEQGAKRAILLPVSVPSHCSLMQNAAIKLREHIEQLNWQMPKIAVIHNVNAAISSNLEELKDNLVKQLYSPVRWVDSIQNLADLGVTDIKECGPGKVLTGLNKRIAKNINHSYIEANFVS